MVQRPSFGAPKKNRPTFGVMMAAADGLPAAQARQAPRMQIAVPLEPVLWPALNDLATGKRIDTGRRVTARDLLIEGGRHVLAATGFKLSKQQGPKRT